MKADDFLQLGDDLVGAALLHGETLEARGYSVEVEPYDPAYPYSPTFLAIRDKEELFVEVRAGLDWDVIEEWCRYGKSCAGETRVCLALPEAASSEVTAADMERLRTLGAGLRLVGASGPYEAVLGKDLALNAALPELPQPLRSVLGGAYDKFDRGDWRESFRVACTAVEQEAKEYLATGITRGRIVTHLGTGSRREQVTEAKARTLTLGALAKAFANITAPNQSDSRIAQVLAQINDDRITVAHFELGSPDREKTLRTNVGRHMFRIVTALRAIRGL